jgi:hypothetical protein
VSGDFFALTIRWDVEHCGFPTMPTRQKALLSPHLLLSPLLLLSLLKLLSPLLPLLLLWQPSPS